MSSKLIRDLREHCHGLEDDRITVRSKSVDALRHLLSSRNAVEALHATSSCEKSGSFGSVSWDELYRSAFRYLKRESSSSVKSSLVHERVSSGASLLKSVIRQAGKNLRSSPEILKDMLDVLLEDSSLRKSFGFDAMLIIERLISVPEHCRRFSVDSWSARLPKAAISLFESPPKDADFLALSKFFSKVVSESHTYSMVSYSLLRLSFLADILNESKLGAGASEAKVAFLDAVLRLLKEYERDERRAICAFGEATLGNVLAMFDDASRHQRHGVIVSFLRFQVSVHHPLGARTAEEGFYAKDETLWMKHLYGIYSNVLDTWILNHRSRSTFKSPGHSLRLEGPLLDLGVQVVRQLFLGDSEVIRDITQVVPLNETLSSQQPSAKRRRVLQIGFEALCENIRDEDKNISIPWLQILHCLLTQYPKDSLSVSQFANVYSQVNYALQSSKIISVKCEILRALEALKGVSDLTGYKADWSTVWESALNIVSLNQCAEEGHSLIRLLLAEVPSKELRRLLELYTKKIMKCNIDSIRTLVTLMSITSIPNSERQSILSWLCPHQEDEFNASVDSWTRVLEEDPALMASLLIGLSLQSQLDLSQNEPCSEESVHLKWESSQYNNKSSLSSNSSDESKQLELLILESDLILMPDNVEGFKSSKGTSSRIPFPQVNAALTSLINDLLIRLSGEVLTKMNAARNDANSSEFIKKGLLMTSLLSSILGKWANVYPEEASSPLQGILESCIKQSGATSCKALGDVKGPIGVLALWKDFLGSQGNEPLSDLWNNIPLNFIEKAMQCFLRECKALKSPPIERHKKSNTDEFDDFDDIASDDPMEVDEFQESTSEKMNLKRRDVHSLLSSLVPLSCPSVSLSSNSARRTFFSELRGKIFEVLESLHEHFEDEVRLEIVGYMIGRLHDDCIDEDFLETVLNSCQNIAKRSMRPKNFNPHVSLALLDCLIILVPHVNKKFALQSRNTVFLNNFLMFLIAFFRMNAQLQYKRLSLPIQSKILDFLHCLTTTDPCGDWALMPAKIHNLSIIQESQAGGIHNEEEVSVHVGKSLIRFLGHSSHRLREQGAKKLSILFSSKGKPVGEKLTDFKLLLSTLMYLQQSKSPESTEDDQSNRFGTLLLALGCVSSCCEYLERESISRMIIWYYELDVPLLSLSRMIINLAHSKGFEKVENYFAPMLGYVLKKFISKNYQLKDFPFAILSSGLPSFLRQYESVIVPLLIWHNHEALPYVTKLYGGKTKVQIITDNFSVLCSYFLPIIAAKDESPELLRELSSSRAIQQASRLHELVFNVLKKECFDFNLTSKVHEILTEVFKNIHDPSALASEFDIKAPELSEPSPPYTNQELVMNLIRYFGDRIPDRNGRSLLEFLGDNISSCLLDMTLNFMTAFKTPTDGDTRIRSLHGVKIFIDSLCPSSSFKHFPFIMWYLTDALLKSLTDPRNSDLIVRLSLRVLHSLLEVCIAHSSSLVHPFYVPIVDTLISISSSHEVEVQPLLDTLILESSTLFEEQIKKLTPFPESMFVFEKYNDVLKNSLIHRSLLEDIHSFLDERGCPSAHRLECLLLSLSTKKEELDSLLEEMKQSEILSENTLDSPLHSLIHRLLELFRKDVGEKKTVSRCLGEIGPLNLSSVVIRPFPNILTSSADIPEKIYLKEIVTLLLDLILSEHQATTVMAYEALCNLCRVDIFSDVVASMTTCQKAILAPFYNGLESDDIVKTEVLVDLNFRDPLSWFLEENEDVFDVWIKEKVSLILDKYFGDNAFSIFTPLKALCSSSSVFCEQIFPFLIHVLLLYGDDGVKEEISKKINNIFNENLFNKGNHKSIKLFLNVVGHLRLQNLPRPRRLDTYTTWKNNFWLHNINYLHVAEASLASFEYFQAILYVEIWTQTMMENYGQIRLKMSSADRSNILDILHEDFPQETSRCQRILCEAFEALGNIDAINGCGDRGLFEGTGVSGVIEHLALEGERFKVLGFCDSLMPATSSEYLRTMFDSGLYHTLYSYLVHNPASRNGEDDDNMRDLRYECAWRLGQWDDVQSSGRRGSFSENRYVCLSKCIRGEAEDLSFSLDKAWTSIRLRDVHSSIGVSKALGQFMALRDIECLRLLKPSQESQHLNYKYSVDTKWQRVIYRESLLHGSGKELELLGQWERECTQLAELALNNADFNVAKNCILSLKRHSALGSSYLRLKSQFLESKLLWEWNNKDTALRLLRKLSQELLNVEAQEIESLHPQVLGTLGQWMYTLKSESAPIILNKYLTKSVSLYEEGDIQSGDKHVSLILEAYINLASFCDHQYQNLTDHMNSKDFEDKQKLMKEIQEESSNLNEVGESKVVKQSAVILNRHSNIDRQEVESIQRDQRKYLLLALKHYLNAFITGDSKYDLKIFRFVSLWFSNSKEIEVSSIVGEQIKKIRSFKFVNLLYQLAARMTLKKEDANFGSILMNLMLTCLKDHPYHTLPVILALVNSQADDAFTSAKNSSKRIPSGVDEDRTAAAKKLLECFKKVNKFVPLLSDLERICECLIQFAYEESPSAKSEGKIKIPPSKPLRRLNNLDHVPILTETIPVSKSGRYSFVGIKGFSDFYENVGGVNAPKKIYVRGSDGVQRPMLVKGKDDLRQDAVMQQVFNLLNSLMHRDPNLKVQTYKVVALSQRSGVLEWCVNTSPLKDYLIGPDYKSGAHVRFYPQDYTAYDCRVRLSKAQASKDHSHKLKAFNNICENFHPVMRHFFLENFPSPESHYERREAYTRSAAAASMVGYILGLGDRHIQNILIHKKTAHLVHIDLGIAFEQGKILPSPETIPFRLTRDIVDGFGPCGVEGTFRRSCESTLSVLRSNKESIATILQVMVHDPLYNWSLTPEKAYRLQFGKAPDAKTKARWEQTRGNDSPNGQENGGNRMAERVLLRVAQKLDGFEEGYNMSIQGQVNALIHQARDPNRLCALFHGWSPFV